VNQNKDSFYTIVITMLVVVILAMGILCLAFATESRMWEQKYHEIDYAWNQQIQLKQGTYTDPNGKQFPYLLVSLDQGRTWLDCEYISPSTGDWGIWVHGNILVTRPEIWKQIVEKENAQQAEITAAWDTIDSFGFNATEDSPSEDSNTADVNEEPAPIEDSNITVG
jgi:hypothetical protein